MGWTGRSAIGPSGMKTAENEARAIELRVQGFTLKQIGEELGFSIPYVVKLIHKGLKRTVQPHADDLRELELHRLDAMWTKAFELASERASKDHIDACIKIMKRRAELLGLDAPAKKEITGKNGGPLEMNTNVMFYLPDNGRG